MKRKCIFVFVKSDAECGKYKCTIRVQSFIGSEIGWYRDLYRPLYVIQEAIFLCEIVVYPMFAYSEININKGELR